MYIYGMLLLLRWIFYEVILWALFVFSVCFLNATRPLESLVCLPVLNIYAVFCGSLILMQKVRFFRVVISVTRFLQSRLFRCVLCFLVICCLLVNVSPIRAKAVTNVVILGCAATFVVMSVVIGLGVRAGLDTSVFDDVVTGAVSAVSDFCANGLINIANYTRTDGISAFAVPLVLVETIRDYLFDSGVVSIQSIDDPFADFDTDASASSHSYAYALGKAAQADSFAIIYTKSGELRVFYAGNAGAPKVGYPVYVSSDGKYITTDSSNKCYWRSTDGQFVVSGSQALSEIASYEICSGDITESIVSSLDVSLGSIAAPSDPFADGYADWYANAVSIPGSLTGSDDDVVGVPLGLGQTYEATRDKTQEEVWAGTSEYTVADTDTDTEAGTDTGSTTGAISQTWLGGILQTIISTLSDIWEAIKSIPQAIVDGITAVLQAIFVPDIAVIESAVADLRAQFPFFDSIIATGQYLSSGFSSGSPPVVYVHLGDAEGSLDWGGTVAILDMNFYSRYKAAGDLIISSALWTYFAWRTFKKLPGLISGADSDIEILFDK